jgi:phospho-N-acetylmuramoyl-pentapeptide-transferase
MLYEVETKLERVVQGQGSFLIAGLIAFFGTLLLTKLLMKKLPCDLGREFAVDGTKSKGKPRGAGIVFVSVFVVAALICAPNIECFLYMVLVFLAMLTGFLDDAAKVPWGEYRKGLLDFLIAVMVAVVYLYFQGNSVYLALFHVQFEIPYILYGVLIVVLVWASINVTNCSDGVDGLSATLSMITLATITGLSLVLKQTDNWMTLRVVPMFILVLLAYLWYNATPSVLLMGDAGSRAMGLLISIAILMTQAPVFYLLAATVLIFDGGLGLVKVSLKRFLKISILTNTTCPLHDHVRKNKGWSNTQVVFRFAIIQLVISAVALTLVQM